MAVPVGRRFGNTCISEGGTGVYFQLPDLARFLVEEGSRIAVYPEPDCRWEEVEPYLLGTAMAIIYHQRRIHPLHAACLARSDVAIAMAGDSGEGKTTLAMTMMRRGSTLLTDDVVPLEWQDERLLVHAEKPVLKLWRDSANHFDIRVDGLAPILYQEEKYYLPTEMQVTEPSYLQHLVVLVSDDSLHKPVLEPVNRLEALAYIRQHTHRPSLVQPIWGEQEFLGQSMAVASAIKVWRLTRPRSLSQLIQAAELIESLYEQ